VWVCVLKVLGPVWVGQQWAWWEIAVGGVRRCPDGVKGV